MATTGNNNTGTGSRSQPFQTVNRALQGVRPGDAIRLLPGTYSGGMSVTGLSGTSNAPIWLGGIPGETRPMIAGGSTAIQLSRVQFVVLENLDASDSTANGINCDDGGEYANPNATHHLVFRSLSIRNVGTGGNQDGLKLSGVNDYVVMDCNFTRMSAGGSGIDHVGCHHGLIARCTFTEMGSNAIQCKGGSEDIEIRWSQFVNGGGRAINVGGSTGFEFFRPPLTAQGQNFEARDIRVVANLFRGSDAPIAFVGAVDSVAAQNTIVEPTRWILRVLQETVSNSGYIFRPSGHNRFVNNLIYFNRAQISTDVNIGPNTDASSFEFANNLWYALNQPNQSKPFLPVAEKAGLYGLNPLFQDRVAGIFSVLTNSPAVGKGLPLALAKADLLEHCYALNPTLGAFEALPPPTRPLDTDGDLLPDAWEDANGLNRYDPADATEDPDGDRFSNAAEYLAGTDPKNPGSIFSLSAARIDDDGFAFRYPTLTARTYKVQTRSLEVGPWVDLAVTNGTGNVLEYREPIAGAIDKLFRVKIEPL